MRSLKWASKIMAYLLNYVSVSAAHVKYLDGIAHSGCSPGSSQEAVISSSPL